MIVQKVRTTLGHTAPHLLPGNLRRNPWRVLYFSLVMGFGPFALGGVTTNPSCEELVRLSGQFSPEIEEIARFQIDVETGKKEAGIEPALESLLVDRLAKLHERVVSDGIGLSLSDLRLLVARRARVLQQELMREGSQREKGVEAIRESEQRELLIPNREITFSGGRFSLSKAVFGGNKLYFEANRQIDMSEDASYPFYSDFETKNPEVKSMRSMFEHLQLTSSTLVGLAADRESAVYLSMGWGRSTPNTRDIPKIYFLVTNGVKHRAIEVDLGSELRSRYPGALFAVGISGDGCRVFLRMYDHDRWAYGVRHMHGKSVIGYVDLEVTQVKLVELIRIPSYPASDLQPSDPFLGASFDGTRILTGGKWTRLWEIDPSKDRPRLLARTRNSMSFSQLADGLNAGVEYYWNDPNVEVYRFGPSKGGKQKKLHLLGSRLLLRLPEVEKLSDTSVLRVNPESGKTLLSLGEQRIFMQVDGTKEWHFLSIDGSVLRLEDALSSRTFFGNTGELFRPAAISFDGRYVLSQGIDSGRLYITDLKNFF